MFSDPALWSNSCCAFLPTRCRHAQIMRQWALHLFAAALHVITVLLCLIAAVCVSLRRPAVSLAVTLWFFVVFFFPSLSWVTVHNPFSKGKIIFSVSFCCRRSELRVYVSCAKRIWFWQLRQVSVRSFGFWGTTNARRVPHGYKWRLEDQTALNIVIDRLIFVFWIIHTRCLAHKRLIRCVPKRTDPQ